MECRFVDRGTELGGLNRWRAKKCIKNLTNNLILCIYFKYEFYFIMELGDKLLNLQDCDSSSISLSSLRFVSALKILIVFDGFNDLGSYKLKSLTYFAFIQSFIGLYVYFTPPISFLHAYFILFIIKVFFFPHRLNIDIYPAPVTNVKTKCHMNPGDMSLLYLFGLKLKLI